MRASLLALLGIPVLCLIASCGDDDAPPADASVDTGVVADAGPTGAVATFDVPSDGPIAWSSIPFPHQLHVGADGTLDVGAAPVDSELWRSIVDTINVMDGFCRSCSLTFPVVGDLDPTSLPSDAGPTGTASSGDAVVMMRLDGEGGFIPVDVDWTHDDGAVMVRPAGLRVLPPSVTYVAAITSALLAADGSALAPSETFLAARDEASGPTAEADRVRAVIGPALDALETAGVARDSVVSLAVYTTRDTGEHLRQIAAVEAAAALPVATVARVFRASDGTLDELLGTPAEERPGRDNAAAAGTVGDTALSHDRIEMIILGSFEAPRIVEGTGTEIGFVRRSPTGEVEPGPNESVPFLLVIPRGADVTSLPVVMHHAGQGGTRMEGVIVGNTLAGAGFATLCTDPFQLASRTPSGADEQHNARGGDLGPDGLYEHSDGDAQLRLQGVSGNAPGLGFHPSYAHGAGSQRIADGIAAVRFLRDSDLASLAVADPALTGLAFDDDRIFWEGLSFGSWVGMSVAAVTEGIAAAVFSVGPGSLVETACNAPGTRAGLALLLDPLLGIEGAFDEVDRHLCMNPLLAVFRMVLEDAEPQSALHYFFREPLVTAEPPDVLFQYMGFDETIGTTAAELVLAEAGVPVDGSVGFTQADITLETAPFTANTVTPNGTITAGAWYFPMAGHVALLEQRQTSRMEPPVLSPFVLRDAPLEFDNPIEQVQGQARDFFASRSTAGRATVSTPPAP